MNRAILAAVMFVGLLLVGCATGGADDSLTVTEAQSGLVLSTATPEHVAGRYTRDGITVRFDSLRTKDTQTFVLTTGDGHVLVSTAGVGSARAISVSDGKLTFVAKASTSEITVPDQLAIEPEGDQNAFADVMLSKEAEILPWLSRTLGERGITGRDYPASLDLHTFAALAARVRDIQVPPLDAPDLDTRGAQACGRAPGNDACYGMCGYGCSCWKWVCGDCCYHSGCAAHDRDCRKCSWRNPWACTKCATFASFWTGGGC